MTGQHANRHGAMVTVQRLLAKVHAEVRADLARLDHERAALAAERAAQPTGRHAAHPCANS
jgi:hypothetical protein